MKRMLPLIFLVLLAYSPSMAQVEWAKESFPEILKKAQDQKKHVFIDFYAVWCGPCKMLDKTTYKDEKVAAFLNSIIPVKYDSEKGEGKELAEKFKIRAYPTLILLDPSGKEIDRYLGYVDPINFLKVMKNYMKGIGTISYYEKELKKKPDDLEILYKLGGKYTNISNEEKALTCLEKILSLDPKNEKGYTDDAYLNLGELFYNLRKYEKSTEYLEALMEKFPDSKNLQSAVPMMARAYEKLGDNEKGLKIYKRFLSMHPDDPKAMNAFAWFCATHKVALEEALPYAEKAVELSGGDPGIMDTLAEVHYAMGDYEKAVSIEEEASKKNPDDAYFKDQIIKYLKAALKEAKGEK